jgi:hypothetical protein
VERVRKYRRKPTVKRTLYSRSVLKISELVIAFNTKETLQDLFVGLDTFSFRDKNVSSLIDLRYLLNFINSNTFLIEIKVKNFFNNIFTIAKTLLTLLKKYAPETATDKK